MGSEEGKGHSSRDNRELGFEECKELIINAMIVILQKESFRIKAEQINWMKPTQDQNL